MIDYEHIFYIYILHCRYEHGWWIRPEYTKDFNSSREITSAEISWWLKGLEIEYPFTIESETIFKLKFFDDLTHASIVDYNF